MNKSLSISALATPSFSAFRKVLFALPVLGLSMAGNVRAATDTWQGGTNTWAAGFSPVWTSGSTAQFSGVGAQTSVVNLNAAQNAAGISVTGAQTGTVLLEGGGTASQTLTLGTGGITIASGAGAVTIGSASANQGVNINLNGTQSWTNNSSAGALTVTNNVSNSTTTPAVLTLAGSGTSGITINGNITDNGAGTIAVTNSAGTNTLAGTNTYSGTTTVNGGTLKVQGSGALSANTAISLGSGTFLVQNDGPGSNVTISLGNNITLNNSTTDVISVSDLGGVNMGNTVAFGALSMGGPGVGVANTVNFTGANGYLESFSSLSLAGSNGQTTTLNPTTTSVTITGAVTNPMTAPTGSNYDTLVLGGTSSGNSINGVISDATGATGFGQFSGNTNITKNGTSTWTLAGANTFHGNIVVSSGTLNLTSSNSTNGSTTVAASSILNLSGSLTGATAITNSGTFNESGAGVISSAAMTFTNTTGTATLSGANTYTGATTVTAGTLQLNGANGTLALSGTAVALNGGSFILDNTGASSNSNNRIADTQAFTLAGGSFVYKGSDQTSTNSTETIGAISGAGNSTVTVSFGGTNGATLTAASFSHTAGNATDLVNGVNLGKNSTDTASFARLISTAAPTLTGTTAAVATGAGTVKNLKIVPFLVGESSSGLGTATGTANSFVTYVAGSGYRPLDTTNEFTQNATTTGNNIYVTSATAASSNAINSLVIKGGDLSIGNGVTLTNTSGALLFASSNTIGTGGTTGAYTGSAENQITVNSGVTGTISAIISGTQPLTKSGAGTLVLSGANTYTGATTLDTGTLNLSNQLALQDSILNQAAGSTLVFDSAGGTAFTLGGLNSSVNIALQNNTPAAIALTLNVASGATPSYSGVLSGGATSSLIKAGSGTQTLSGANTYSGSTAVNGGTLQLSGSIANSVVTVGSGAFLSFNGGNGGKNESTTISGVLSGQGGFIDNQGNQNTVTSLDKANTYTGPTELLARGTLQTTVAAAYDGSGNMTSSGVGVNSALIFAAGLSANVGETVLLGANSQLGSLSTNGATVAVASGNGIVLNGFNLITGGDNTSTTWNAQISGGPIPNGGTTTGTRNFGGNLTKIGTGTQTLGGSDLYSGATTINGGTLSVTTLANGGITTTGSITTGTNQLTVANVGNLAVGQVIQSTVLAGSAETITAISGNVLTLSGNASATLTNGPIVGGAGNGLGISTNAASNLVLDGGTLQYTGAATSTDRLFTVGSNEAAGVTGTLDASGTGAVTFSNTGSVAYGTTNQARTLGLTGSNTGANTLAPLIADNGTGAVSVLKSGVGSWTLTNANTYSGGTTVTAGILNSAVAGGFGAGNVTVAPTGTLLANSATLNSTGSISSTALVTVNNNGAAIGTVNFNGATPSIGGLSGNGNAVLNNATGTVLTVGGNNSTSTFGGVISEVAAGMGSLTKEGTGTLRLNGANTYTGSTTVNAGTLIVGGSTAAGSAVTINNGGTLGGTGSTNEGTLNGTVTVASGTTGSINLQDGAIGTLSVGGLTVNGGKLSFDLGGGLTSDSIASAGALTINGATTINLGYVSGTPSLSNGTYSLITYNNGGGALGSTAFGNLTLNTSALAGTNQTFTLVNNAGNLEVNVASSYTKTTYTLTTSAASTLLHAGGSTALTTTLTNTGSGTDDSLAYSGVGASTASGTVAGATINSPPTVPNGNNSVSNTNQTFSTAVGSSGTATISSTGTVTDSHLGDTPSGTSTGTSITVYSGFGTWITNGSGTWGTAPTAVPVNWSAAGGTPGVTAGFTGVDTATFGAQTATAITVGLNGAAPNLNAITFSSPDTAYTLAQNYAGGTGTSSITLSGTTPSINVTNPGSSLTAGTQTISAPLILGATTSLNVAANQKLNISGQISSAGTFGLTNSGPGTTTLTSDTGNTYTGPTTITGGTVFIKNTSGSATGTGAVTVSGSSTVLKGHGEIDGAVTLSGGATLFSGSTSAGTGPGTGMKLTSALAVNGAALTFQLSNGTNSATYANPNTTTSYLDLGTTGTVSFSGMDTINLVDLSNGGLTLRLQSPYLLISGSSSSVFYGLVIRTSSGAIGLSQNGFQGSVLGVWTGTGDDYKEFTFNQYGSDGITPLAPTDAGNTTGAYISPFLYLSGGNLEVVPEPSTWALMIGGLALLIVIQRRKHRSN